MKAVLFVGGWEGHAPTTFSDWCEDLLRKEGFEVAVHQTLAPLADPVANPASQVSHSAFADAV